MDVIWKHLSDNHPTCRRLSLYSQSDPGTGATFAVRCNSLIGVTSEENFLNDAMYLVEGVLPLNDTLETVEMEWSFLSHLEEEARDNFIRGVASLKKLEEISIRGVMSEESRLRFRSLLQIPECAKGLKHLAIELDEVHVEDPSEMGLAALLFLRCQHLESFHVRGLMPAPNNEGGDFDCSILLSALGKLPALHTIHMSRNQENPKTVNTASLRDLCALPNLQSLSMMNMGLTDKHCKVFKRCLYNSRFLHSLILVDNPAISEKGNKALLRLLEKNRSIYNSTFGTDSETIHRTSQLVHLHLNRCGRSKVQSPTKFDSWLTYLSRINETVPEELELDTLLIAVQENPEMIIQHCAERDLAQQEYEQRLLEDASREDLTCENHPLYPSINVAVGAESNKVVTPKKLPTRKDMVVLNDWESVFPMLTSRDSIDSTLSPPLPLSLPHQDPLRQSPSQEPPVLEESITEIMEDMERDADITDEQSELEQEASEVFVREDNPDDRIDVESFEEGTEPSSMTCASTSTFDPGDALSVPVNFGQAARANFQDQSLSWDGVVADLERTADVVFGRFRDEACWLYIQDLPPPPSHSLSTPC